MNDDLFTADTRFGKRIKQRRESLGLSRENLAMTLNISVERLVEFEEGLRGIETSHLLDLSRALYDNVGSLLQLLLEELTRSPVNTERGDSLRGRDPKVRISSQLRRDIQISELIDAFFGIEEENLRKKLLALMWSFHKTRSSQKIINNVITLSDWRSMS